MILENNILTIVTFLPLVGAFFILLTPGATPSPSSTSSA